MVYFITNNYILLVLTLLIFLIYLLIIMSIGPVFSLIGATISIIKHLCFLFL